MEFYNGKKAKKNGEKGSSAHDFGHTRNGANENGGSQDGLLVNYGVGERKVLVIYTGGTIGMVNNSDGCKL